MAQRLRRVALLVALLGLVAGCSSDGGTPERADAASTTTAAAAGEGADTSAGAPPGPPPLRLALVGTLGFDPASASPASPSATILADLVHDTLTELDDAGAPRPGLADFVPNADLTAWRFTLVEGATFADGTPIEADDVVASIERIRALGGASLAAIPLEDVTSVTALDPRTVEVALASPSALLPVLLSAPVYGIIDREAVPGGLDAPVNPSGDHRVAEAAPDRVVLERRRGEGPDRLVLRILRDDGAAADAFVTGQVDWAPAPVDRLGQLEVTGEELAPFHATVLLGVNPSVEPLPRPQLRQAIALAVDRDAIAAAVFGPTAGPATGLIPTGVPGARDACVGPCGPALDQARQLVAQAYPEGVPDDLALSLLTDQTSTHEAIARILVEQLGRIGIDVTVQAMDDTTYGQLLGTGQTQLSLHSSLGIARTPSVHLLPWASSSPDNTTRYRNDLVDLALQAAVREPDRAARLARWQEIESAILGDAPVVPLVQLRTVAATSDRVHGLVIHADGSIDLSGVELG